MFDITLTGAFLAGLLSFVSPCVLPLVPPYLCFLAGVSLDELTGQSDVSSARGRVVRSAVAFVLGFSAVFIGLGAAASSFGQLLRDAMAWTVDIAGFQIGVVNAVAGLIIIAMGLHFLGVFRIAFLYREARVHVEKKPAGLVGAFLIGMAFAFGWTPCVGPILSAILFMASTEDTVSRGAVLLGAYAAGIGVPFLLAAIFSGPFLKFMQRFRRHMGTVEKVMGGLLVLTGVFFVTGQMATFSFWLLETFPWLGDVEKLVAPQ
ncbi:MAG: cytochrome c biogenesis protein CcdA [Rhodobiaceae bacterium]|nr:cytochrome c biogenesis protein CcdA [Rhodobiaceae bacterium]MCC0053879.1 cytochrome c biogenesis protein CcdA [Rhodobiaceae bacterium]